MFSYQLYSSRNYGPLPATLKMLAEVGYKDTEGFGGLYSDDATLTELTALQGGCERIKRTPIPLAYRFFAQTFVRAFVLLLPFALVEQLGVFTIVASLLVAFVFLVLDRIGDIIQDPFTTNYNGLPLAAICRTIEVDLRRQLGETDVPPLLTAQRVPGGHATSVLL